MIKESLKRKWIAVSLAFCMFVVTVLSGILFVDENGRIVKVCIHYPSYRRSTGCRALDAALPWKRAVESI